jgi:hypothetical protein
MVVTGPPGTKIRARARARSRPKANAALTDMIALSLSMES